MRILFLLTLTAVHIMVSSCHSPSLVVRESNHAEHSGNEVIYHVVQRSFYDSNGDAHGDLNGLRHKLDYLQELGVTSILLLPLYESVYYHNYFSGNFEKIDPEFGTEADYINLVKEIHRRGMKLYMDMETQYITEDHIWYRDSYGNPSSPFSGYLVYEGPGNTNPTSIIYDLTGLKGYDGTFRKITTVNLTNEKVKEYNYQLFKHWTDPNNDGRFDDGVDGFRLDHMMDDLDNKGKWTNLFRDFWKPLVTKLKKINPALVFMAEQANWGSLGLDYLDQGGVDRVFAFRIGFEIRNFNKQKLVNMADSIFGFTPAGKQQVVFIENHDMPRFSFVVKKDPAKLKLGAAINLLIGGIPSLYYGQELGMYGTGRNWGLTDANELPVREAFEWYRADTGRGMALWYKNSGPWWDSTNLVPNDGISWEEQKNDPSSLWNFYRDMLRLRKTNPLLVHGIYRTLPNNNDSVFSFLRYEKQKAALVVVNLSFRNQPVDLDLGKTIKPGSVPRRLWGGDQPIPHGNGYRIQLSPHGINVWELSTE